MRPILIVHGGAGDVPEARRAARALGCRRAAEAGLAILSSGGGALLAAIRACEVLEDDPLFNAGTGACLNAEGALELDASIMEGTELEAGAVACLPPFRNPIRVADAVRRAGRHVMYAGEGAARFARSAGFEPVEASEMITDAARARLDAVLGGKAAHTWAGGTVGAVACDADGHLAAATSTGGTVAKAPGRVGDTPVIGAGTWADDHTGACSTTGNGEQILRFGVARHACELLRGSSAQEAADHTIEGFQARVNGRGGLILIDRHGRAAFARNTETMSWAIASEGLDTRFGH